CRFDRTFNAAKVVAGKLPDQSNADEIAVPVAVADRLHARVGRTLTFDFASNANPPKVIRKVLRIVAITASPGEFPPESDLGPPAVHATPAFYEQNKDALQTFPYSLVRLQHGAADL